MNFVQQRRANRQAITAYMAACILAALDDEILDLMGIPAPLRTAIYEIRTDDDYMGKAAAFFCFSISNRTLSDSDRLVVGQTLTVGGGGILANKVVSKLYLDDEDVLRNRTILQSTYDALTKASTITPLAGDALLEEGIRLHDYYEQYSSEVKDRSLAWSKGGTGDSEDPKEGGWFDWIPGFGQ